MSEKSGKTRSSKAFQAVLIFGLISLFADIVYEGARSTSGQYLQLLGANATAVGFIVGVGEFLAYFLRLLAGTAADKSRKYWPFIFAGYGMLIVVPMMGITSEWKFVLAFVMSERIGKALRNPAKDTILSHVAEGEVGIGIAFGIQEALDQLGAASGPLVFATVFRVFGKSGLSEYQHSFRVMTIPYALMMLVIYAAYRKVKKDKLFELGEIKRGADEKMQKIFWIYTLFTFFTLLGFANFPLIGYHLKYQGILTDTQITLLYSFTMIVDAVVALIIGYMYDKVKQRTGNKQGGILVLLFVPFATTLIAYLALGTSLVSIVIGLFFYGAVMGAHETIMRSAIADITPLTKRGTGYGIFNTAYGAALFSGSALFGFLYDRFSVSVIQVTVVVAQIAAIVVFFVMRKQISAGKALAD